MGSCGCLYESQESRICVYLKGVESPTKKMARVVEILLYEWPLSPRQS